jgi:hypothetical protein
VRLDVVARELRERDAFLSDLTPCLRAEHAQTLEDAGNHTTLIRMLRGVTGRGMSMVWALNDYLPADGGPTLMERYIARPELSPSASAIARGLAEAPLDVYRVRSVTIRSEATQLLVEGEHGATGAGGGKKDPAGQHPSPGPSAEPDRAV